jgi:hypothetical protein
MWLLVVGPGRRCGAIGALGRAGAPMTGTGVDAALEWPVRPRVQARVLPSALWFVGRLSADFDVDLDGNAIGDHVVDGRPAAGLLDDLAEHVFGGVPLDSELDRDLLVAVAHRL